MKPTTDWKPLVLQLKEVASKSNLNQTELALKTGLLQSSISRIFACQFVPRINTLLLIADALDVDLKIVCKE